MQRLKKPRTAVLLAEDAVMSNVQVGPPSAAVITQPTTSDYATAKTAASLSALTFTWSELDIGFDCPNVGCEDSIPPNLPRALIDRFREYALAEHNGADKVTISKLEMKICVELGMFRVLDRATRMQKQKGYPTVDLRAIPDRILQRELDIMRLVGVPTYRDKNIGWQELLLTLKVSNSSLEALAKGKKVPDTVCDLMEPG